MLGWLARHRRPRQHLGHRGSRGQVRHPPPRHRADHPRRPGPRRRPRGHPGRVPPQGHNPRHLLTGPLTQNRRAEPIGPCRSARSVHSPGHAGLPETHRAGSPWVSVAVGGLFEAVDLEQRRSCCWLPGVRRLCDDAHMMRTSAFAGKMTGSYQYLFFVLYEDYTDFARTFITEFNNVYLERLARNLKGRGAVFVPFTGEVEETRAEVLSKDLDQRGIPPGVPGPDTASDQQGLRRLLAAI
jgi:hypothetical protein